MTYKELSRRARNAFYDELEEIREAQIKAMKNAGR